MKVVILAICIAFGVACGPAWHEYRSPDGDFAVTLPGEPQQVDTVIDRPSGTRHIRGVRTDLQEGLLPPYLFVFYVTSYEKAGSAAPLSLTQSLDAARDETLSDLKASFISELPLLGSAGREVVIKIPPDVRLVERIFLRNGRVYKVGAAERESASRSHTDRFLQSFQFSEPSR